MQVEIDELLPMVAVLAEDADYAREIMDRDNSDYSKRVYVRAIFAWIEGVCLLMRQHALRQRLKLPISVDTIPELAILLEQSYSITDAGEPKVSELRTSTPSNLMASVIAFYKANPKLIGKTIGKTFANCFGAIIEEGASE